MKILSILTFLILSSSLYAQTLENFIENDEVVITSRNCNLTDPFLLNDYLSIQVGAIKPFKVNEKKSFGITLKSKQGSCSAVCDPKIKAEDDISSLKPLRNVTFEFPKGLVCNTKLAIFNYAAKLCYVAAHNKCDAEVNSAGNNHRPDAEDLKKGGYLSKDKKIVTNIKNENLSDDLNEEKVDASDPLGYCKIGASKDVYSSNHDDVFNPILEKYCYCYLDLNEEGIGNFSGESLEMTKVSESYSQCHNMACYVNNHSDGQDDNFYDNYRSDRQPVEFNLSPTGSGVTFSKPFCSDRDMNQWFRDYRKNQKEHEEGLAEKVDELCSISASSNGDNRRCRNELSEITKILFKEETIDACQADARNNGTHRAEHSCEDLKSYEKILGASISTPFESVCSDKLGENATEEQLNACGLKYTQDLTNSYFQTELAKCESPAFQSAASVRTCQNLVLENIISHSSDEDVVKMAACVDNNPGNMSEIKLCVGDIIVNSIANDTLLEQLKEQYCTAKRDDEGNIYNYLTAAEQRECLHTLLIHNTADLNDELKKCLSIEDETERSTCQRDILIKAIVEDRRFDVEACWEYPLTVSNPYRNERQAKRANPFDRSRMDRNMCVDLSKHVSYEAQICEAKTSITDKINCFGAIKPKALATTYLSRKIGRLFKNCDGGTIPTETQNLCAKKAAFDQCKNAPAERQMTCMLNMMDEQIVAKVEDTNRHCLEQANPDQCFQAANQLNQNGLIPDANSIASFTNALNAPPVVTDTNTEINTNTNTVTNTDTNTATNTDTNTNTATNTNTNTATNTNTNTATNTNTNTATNTNTTNALVGTATVVAGSGILSTNGVVPESLNDGSNANAWDSVNNASRYEDSGATGLFKDTKYMSMKDTNPKSQACSKLKKAAIIRFGGLLTSVGVGVVAGVMAMKEMKKDENGQRNAMKGVAIMAGGATAAVGVKLLANLWARRVVEGAITDETLRRQQDPSSMVISTCTNRSGRKKATSFYFDQDKIQIHDYRDLEKKSIVVKNQIQNAKSIEEVNKIFSEWDDYYNGHENASYASYDEFFGDGDLSDEVGLEEIKFIVTNSIERAADFFIPSAHADNTDSEPVGPKTEAEIMKELTGSIDPKLKNVDQMDSLVLLIDYGEVIGVDTTVYTQRGIDLRKREEAVKNLGMKFTGENLKEETE